MVDSRSEAGSIIERAVYMPSGKRSFGPSSCPWALPDDPNGGVGKQFQGAREGQIAILPMIESVEGLKSVKEFVSVDGVSGIEKLLSNAHGSTPQTESLYDIRSSHDCAINADLGGRKNLGTLALDL